MKFLFKYSLSVALLSMLFLVSCSKTQSYSDLLKQEQKASNWFLAQQKVCNDIPADSVFLTGPDAPFYRMDADGYIYMQVISVGDREIPATGDLVYFTFTRYNINTMYSSNTLDVAAEDGNQDNFNPFLKNTFFKFNDYSSNNSSYFGSGIQVPLSYLGYYSEVNIVLKSYYGFSDENTTCIPYLVNVRYFKSEY